MKSVLLTCAGKEEIVRRVYTEPILRVLREQAGLDDTVLTKESLGGASADAEYIFSTWGMPSLTEEEIGCFFPRLKAVFYGAGSVQGFARPFLSRGVRVFSGWAANGVPVAEAAFAQILLGNKGFFQIGRHYSSGNQEKARSLVPGIPGNYRTKVGIIGAGMIGKQVLLRLRGTDLQSLVFDPFLPDEDAGALGAEKVSLERLFRECRIVSNHLANNAQTVGMLGYDLFSSMPENGVFLNTGRGAQVKEEDLIRALAERPDLTAVLDVTCPEPPVPDSPFFSLPNCFLTPHTAGSLGGEVERMGQYMMEEYLRFQKGEPLPYEVTMEMLKTMA